MAELRVVPTTDAEAIIHRSSKGKQGPLPRLRQLEFHAQVASAVREMRDQMGLSQCAFAPLINLSVDDLVDIENLDFSNDDRLEEILEEARAIIDQET